MVFCVKHGQQHNGAAQQQQHGGFEGGDRSYVATTDNAGKLNGGAVPVR